MASPSPKRPSQRRVTGKAGTKRPAAKPAAKSTAKSTSKSTAKSTARPAARPASRRRPVAAQRQSRVTAGTVVKRILIGLFFTGFTVLVLGVAALVVAYHLIDDPDANADFTTETTRVYYGDAAVQPDGSFGGTLMGEFAVQNRTTIDLPEMPQSIRDAVLAAENRGFWTDPGISLSGIARSAVNIVKGEPLQSGSTITQQYIKVLYLTSDQTVTRKIKEVLLAIKKGRSIEDKREVLEGYLNTIYFGRGAYGIQAAAETYFGVNARDLTLAQSVALADVLNSPGYLDPAISEENRVRYEERYEYILDGLLILAEDAARERAEAEAAGEEPPTQYVVGITPEEYAQALADRPALEVRDTPDRYAGSQGFLLKMVEAELLDSGLYSEDEIQGRGLQIVTTIDPAAQAAAVAAVEGVTAEAAAGAAEPQDPAGLHGALASVAVGTGEIVALYGGPDYIASQKNWATTRRQAGSTFKPYALIAGLRNQFTLSTVLNGNSFTPDGDPVPVNNDSMWQAGPVSLAYATTNSINTAFVDLVLKIPDGPAQVIRAANDLGVPTDESWQPTGRIALGFGEVSPLAAATAFATLGADGAHAPFHLVREVWRGGELTCLYGHVVDGGHCSVDPEEARRVRYGDELVASGQGAGLDVETARTVNYALKSVMAEGTGSRWAGGFPWPVAGKTGSAGDEENKMRAAWFIGYTRQIATAVMFVAGDDGYGDLNAYAPYGNAFYGGTYPGNAWYDYMSQAMAGKEPLEFEPPADRGPVELQPLPTPSEEESPEPEVTIEAPSAEPSVTLAVESPSAAPDVTEGGEPDVTGGTEPEPEPEVGGEPPPPVNPEPTG